MSSALSAAQRSSRLCDQSRDADADALDAHAIYWTVDVDRLRWHRRELSFKLGVHVLAFAKDRIASDGCRLIGHDLSSWSNVARLWRDDDDVRPVLELAIALADQAVCTVSLCEVGRTHRRTAPRTSAGRRDR